MDAKYCECQKVLLNLKWFVKHLCKVFEEKLQRRICKYRLTDTIKPDSETNSLVGSNSSINKIKWNRSLTNSPLLKRLSLTKISKIQFGGTPNRKVTNLNSADPRTARLILLSATTTENEREICIKQFGESVCVVYEYQIGMLESLSSINVVASFVASLLIKIIKNGIIENFNLEKLNLSILLNSELYPRSYLNKSVKTIAIGIANNYLSWNLRQLFTHPGLRYNHVGGENCSNLTIVTQLLCGKTTTGDFRRPDIFGYRNLICHRKNDHYFIEESDKVSIEEGHTTDLLIKSSTETLLDHLHKCYKSIFFVVLDRTVIIDHLLTCQSFKTFCLRELITPILFANVSDPELAKNLDKRLFPNFNLFHISVTSKPLDNNVKSSSSAADDDDASSFCSECRILSKVYDNHAFLC